LLPRWRVSDREEGKKESIYLFEEKTHILVLSRKYKLRRGNCEAIES